MRIEAVALTFTCLYQAPRGHQPDRHSWTSDRRHLQRNKQMYSRYVPLDRRYHSVAIPRMLQPPCSSMLTSKPLRERMVGRMHIKNVK